MIEKSKCEPLGLCLLFLFLCDIIEIEPEGTGINRDFNDKGCSQHWIFLVIFRYLFV